MKQIAILASGAGSNAARIIEHFDKHPTIKVSLIASNKPDAGVLSIALAAGIPTVIIEKERFFHGDGYVGVFQEYQIDFIVLAGFLWKIPSTLVQAFRGRMVNIHPALLPKYGGKGMYGKFVHEAVVASGEKSSGITIHFVDDIYEHGQLFFQDSVELAPGETPESLAARIHELEHRHFPRVIEEVVTSVKS
jgi:phosphoribosylglycinamide formyltransferase-1